MEEKNHSKVENQFKEDPFREDDGYFEIPAEKKIFKTTEEFPLIRNKGKRGVKNIFGNFSRQIVASFIILVVGFLLLNFSAYYSIFKSKIENFFNLKDNNTLQQLVEEKAPTQQTTNNAVELKNNEISPLDMEVTPIDDRIIIPRINQNLPIVRVSSKSLISRDWNALEKEMQEALKDGVVHYPGTSLPGQRGNVAITGHSSYFPWDPGRFKDVFALLHEVEVGDKIVIYYNQEKYLYEVFDKKVVLPEEVDVLKQTPDDRLTLITCTPVGTNLKRLIIAAKPITQP